jgi:hypothetical protein
MPATTSEGLPLFDANEPNRTLVFWHHPHQFTIRRTLSIPSNPPKIQVPLVVKFLTPKRTIFIEELNEVHVHLQVKPFRRSPKGLLN